MKRFALHLAIGIVGAYVFLVNVTTVSSTVGWIMGAAAVLLAAAKAWSES